MFLPDYMLALAAGFFSVFLLGWHGYGTASSDWVFGFLAVIWSLVMMTRLVTLTTPAMVVGKDAPLPQKILGHFHHKQSLVRASVLRQSLGGSYILFFVGMVCFALWQIFCSVFPAKNNFFESIKNAMIGMNLNVSWLWTNAYDWGQFFMLILSVVIMAFVMRTHCNSKIKNRAMMIVFASYAASGFIALLGVYKLSNLDFVTNDAAGISLVGNGIGSVSWFMGGGLDAKLPNLFEILLVEGGVVGLAMVTFLLFVPLGSISLGAQGKDSDTLILVCSLIIGVVLILSAFLPFGPAVGGFMLLCAMGLFLGWGAVDMKKPLASSFFKA